MADRLVFADYQAWTMFKRVEMERVASQIMEHASTRAAGRTALLMYLMLLTYAGKDGTAWPSAETLSFDLLSKKDITSALKLLETSLLVVTERKFKPTGGSSVRYLVRSPMDFNPRLLEPSSTFPTVTRESDFGGSGTSDFGCSCTSNEEPTNVNRSQSKFRLSSPTEAPTQTNPISAHLTRMKAVWDHWAKTHAAHRASKGLQKSSPKFRTHDECIRKALAKHSVEDLKLVIDWAHKANDFHALKLQDGKFLSPAHLFRTSKLGAKIDKANTWKTDGDVAGPVVRGEYISDANHDDMDF